MGLKADSCLADARNTIIPAAVRDSSSCVPLFPFLTLCVILNLFTLLDFFLLYFEDNFPPFLPFFFPLLLTSD